MASVASAAGRVEAVRAAAVRLGPWPLLLASLAPALAVHLPTLGFYFFGDDFVPLSDIATRSVPDYLKDVVLLRDLTPNWRPLTMLVYLLEYRAFGLNAEPFRAVNLLFHLGSIALGFQFVRLVTRSGPVALVAASLFGVHPAHAHTVTYITALPHVLSTFLFTLSLLSLHIFLTAGGGQRWYWLAVAAFLGAILANEAAIFLFPVLLLAHVFFAFSGRRDVWRLCRNMVPFAVPAVAVALAFAGCGCHSVEAESYSPDLSILKTLGALIARLFYPLDMEFPGHITSEHAMIAWVSGAAGFLLLVRGGPAARLGVAFILLGILPYLPVTIGLGSRYTYAAALPFSLLVALLVGWLALRVVRGREAMAWALAAPVVVAMVVLAGQRSFTENRWFVRQTDVWERLVTDLKEALPRPPPGSRVIILDGPWTEPLWQWAWLPSVGKTLYGDVTVRSVESSQLASLPASVRDGAILLAYCDGRLWPLASTGR